ncbi:catalase family protein [Sedimenticola hydrogenitrophicus]|uniref:catalase family protein n=1 Tax=Sedimenticola hydrogenitrophicus TaxID=2967975 RepID=UPI0021A93B72|nr:catalase family protein [Sedimenticola hydrogenitrophicus]
MTTQCRDRRKHPLPLLATGLLLAGGLGAAEPPSTEQLVAEMNQRIAAITRAAAVNGVIPRFNQAKSLGCLEATFRVHGDLDAALRQGLFARPASYRTTLRFANASQQDDSKKDIRGLSIKLFDVDGEPLWGEPGIQDFLLNSYPALFVATPEDFLAFIRARQDDAMLRFFINPFDPHLKSLWILFRARAVHDSPFNIRYWSTTPYRFGSSDGPAVKYSVTPCSDNPQPSQAASGKDQLRAAMQAHLSQGPACLEFGVQPRTRPVEMPIEDASVIWDEEDAPFHTVATLTIPAQAFDSPEALAACEKISFNPWQSLPAHQPLGRMNAVRRETYIEASQLRNREAP